MLRRKVVVEVSVEDERASAYFREHSRSVYRYLAGVYGHEDDAEEVTQQAFLSLHRALRDGTPIADPKLWVIQSARRLMLQRLRSRRPTTLSIGKPRQLSATHAALSRAVDDLPAMERECLVARAEGLRLLQIGLLVGVTMRRAADIVARALLTVRRTL